MRSLPSRVGGPLALTAALTVALLATGCQDALTEPGVGASVQTREALELLPPDAAMVGMMNLRAARESDAVQTATGGAGLGLVSPDGSAEFDRFVRQTGFDPGEDLDLVYVAMPAGGQEHRGAFVGYGRFDRERLERFLATEAPADGRQLVATQINGVTAYLATDEDGSRGGIALPNDQMILAGDEATLTAMIGRLQGAGSQPSPTLQALLDRVAYPDGAWFVARDLPGLGGGRASDDGNPMNVAATRARTVVLSMGFERDGVAVRTFIEPTAETPADELADVFRGSIAAARMGVKDEPAALDMLDGVRVADRDGGVDVQAFLSPAFLAEMHRSSSAH